MVIEMKGGSLLSFDAIQLACQLEEAGHALRVQDGRLIVTKASQLTPSKRAAIQRHRFHLMAIAGYQVPEVV